MCLTREFVPIPDYLLDDYADVFMRQAADIGDGSNSEFAIDATGRWCFVIDQCIAETLRGLFAAGIRTTGCCCGHGSGYGVIGIKTPEYASEQIVEPVCTHEQTPRVTVCEFCWTAV